MSYKILVLDIIHEQGLNLLSDFAEVVSWPGMLRADLIREINQYHGIMVKSGIQLDSEVLKKANKLKVMGKLGSGLDNIDLKAAQQHGIRVISSPHSGARSVAEYTIMVMLMLVRRMLEVQRMVGARDFRRHLMQGRELGKMTVGLVGLGHIGISVAELLRAFGSSIIGYDCDWANEDRFIKLGCIITHELHELVAQVDILSLHIPLTKDTHKLFNANLFSKAKKGLLLVNAARGAIIDSEALLKALESGKVAGAALDVLDPDPRFYVLPNEQDFQHILLGHEKILYTPHIAAQTDETLAAVTLDIVYKMKQILTAG